MKPFIFLIFVAGIYTRFDQVLSLHSCEAHKTCDMCIKDIHLCTWCSADNYQEARCKPATNSSCSKEFTENPVSSSKAFDDRDPINAQFFPAVYNITLRPGYKLDFNLTYRETVDYPVDLYFLIDSSETMLPIKMAVANASKDIYNTMYKLTKNVLLGIGTFSDKNAPPSVMTKINNIKSFKHYLAMTSDFEEFTYTLKNIGTESNYDSPESGLEGLAQAMTCRKLIRWRDRSIKIVILITDDVYHMAGDGKYAGIVQPYDGRCHTDNKTGIYKNDLVMDHPSVSIINKLAVEKGITVLFLVKKTTAAPYQFLKNFIQGSKISYFISSKDSKTGEPKVKLDSEIDKLLSEIYSEITSSVILKTDENRHHVDLSFDPDCRRKNNKACTIKQGEVLKIKSKIMLRKNNGNNFVNISIGIQGMENETMTLNIKIPSCSCDKTSIANSDYCSGQGTKKCGVCECNLNRIGDNCECPVDNNNEEKELRCRPPEDGRAGISKPLCGGHGQCLCGTCSCDEGFKGKYCECETNSCLKMCSGHGDCRCGICSCLPGWTGDACDCSTAACNDVNGKECNGRGKCTCGRCQCKPTASWDARFEQNEDCVVKPCSKCHARQCQLLTKCALCHANKNKEQECLTLCDSRIKVTTNTTLYNINNTQTAVCNNVKADIGCYTRFAYRYDDLNYKIFLLVQTDTNCNESYFVFGGAALGILILLGLLTLIFWKVITEVQDRREYAKFMEARAADSTGPQENPIFKPSVTSFSNPTFNNS